MKQNPCYGCNDRNTSCHAECESYKSWRDEYYQHKSKIDKVKMIDNDLRNYAITTSIKGKKRFHKY